MHSHLLREEDLKVLDWLTPDDHGKRQSDLLSRHQMGTGQWFLDSEPFQTWLRSRGETLFCPGIPGSGKTILASLVVNELSKQFLQNNTPIVGYIFCDYRRQNEQGLSGLLATLLRQISRQSGSISESLRQLHQKHTKLQTRPTYAELEQVLISTATLFPQVFFVIDALDECQSANNCRSDLISYLASVQKKANVNIMYTSRCIPDIENRFQGCFIQHIEAKEDDVGTFVRSRLSRASNPVLQKSGLANAITSTIPEIVNGMFLLAQLYLDALNDTTSAREAHDALLELQERKHHLAPDEENRNALYDAYDIAVERIGKQPPNFQTLGMKTIMWVLFAVRPLSPKELQYALAINKGDSDFDDKSLRDIETILSTCAGLLLIDEQSDTVRPAHFTTQEYFMANKSKYFANAQSDITLACMTLSRFGGFLSLMTSHTCNQQGCIWNENDLNWERWPDSLFQLSVYVTANWGYHAREAFNSHEPSTSNILPILVQLLTDENLAGCVWAYVGTYKLPESGQIVGPGFHAGAVGLHVAAHFDLVEAATDLIKLGANVDGCPEQTETPLMVASKLGNERFVRFLLEHGAKVTKLDPWQRSAVFYAWDSSHYKIVTEILNHVDSIGEPRPEIHQQWFTDEPLKKLQEQFFPERLR
ncbi:Ankyrin-3 [Colletotrichum siamense]|uniref:Ankyrin-3 n=1 Tax=Colletotrichum siamense TaxID=690259 RepID=A0A9P5BR38_COLSI|nr:Ankyrin-3 [Colletotrichum siamense]KAF4848910.1 Ankyrin-3 [Colletotrichum siamense]